MIAAIAWRNVWRNKWRSIVIMMAISAGLTGGIFTVALYNGLTDQKLRTAIDTQTAHIQIHAQGFQQNKDIRLYIKNAGEIRSAAEEEGPVKAIATRLVTTAMAATSNANTGVQLNGVLPEKERQVSTIYQAMVAGSYFEEEKKNQIVISSRTADKLKVGMNEKVIITLQDIHGEIVGAAFRVSGIFRTSHSMFDEANMFVQKQDLERVLSMPKKSNEFAIRLYNIEDATRVGQELQAAFPDT